MAKGSFFHFSGIPLRLVLSFSVTGLGFLVLAIFLLALYRSSMVEQRQDKVRNMVENIYALVDYYHNKVEKEGMSEADAKSYAFQVIRDLPYDVNGYTWINDMNGVMIMHPAMPELEGKNLIAFKDLKGTYLFKEFIHTVQTKGEGFVSYMWPKPNEPKDKPYPKLSYVKGYAPWNWVIGSGIYIDDIDTAFWHAAIISGSLFIALLLFVAMMVLTLSESFKKP